MCGNQKCGAILNKRELIHHENELCEYRKLKCHSCEETTKTLADLEKQTTRMETNQKNMETKLVNMEKNMETQMKNTDTAMKNNTAIMETRMTNVETKMANVEIRMENVETKMAHMKTNLEVKLDAVNIEVKGLRTALVEAFNEMKDVLVKIDGKKEDNARKVSGPSGDRENIIVAGGSGNDSVEMFNWRQRTWSPLQSMSKKRSAATSFVYNNQVVIAGGWCDDMIRMNVDPHPDLSTHWSDCPMKLPAKLAHHSSVLYQDKLMVTGGCGGSPGGTSDNIQEVQVVPPYTVKTL